MNGGSAGIGRAIAAMLVQGGWNVTIVGRDKDKLDQTAPALCNRPRAVAGLPANLAHDVAGSRVDRHLAHFAGLDLLVSNTGSVSSASLEDKTAKALDLEISLNLRTAVRLLQETFPALRRSAQQRGASHDVNISSLTAVETPRNGLQRRQGGTRGALGAQPTLS